MGIVEKTQFYCAWMDKKFFVADDWQPDVFFLFSKAHGGQKMLNGYPKSPIISTVFLSTVVGDVFINPNLKRSINSEQVFYIYLLILC